MNYNAPWAETYTLAQHNLGVLPVGSQMTPRFQYPFHAYNDADEDRGFVFRAWQGPLSEVAGLLPGVKGGRSVLQHPGKVGHLGIAASAHADHSKLHAGPSVLSSVKIARRSFQPMMLAGNLPEGNALIHVTRSLGGKVLGGLSVLVMAGEK